MTVTTHVSRTTLPSGTEGDSSAPSLVERADRSSPYGALRRTAPIRVELEPAGRRTS
jgi:hypothetical protein